MNHPPRPDPTQAASGPGAADIRMVRNALQNAVRIISANPTTADRARLLTNLGMHIGKVDVWLAAQPARADLHQLKADVQSMITAVRSASDASFREADLADAPLLNLDLYEARMFIKGHRNRILGHAFTAARRIAAQHGAAALRHEAYQRQALRQGFIQAYLQINPVPVHRGKAAADQYRRELKAVAGRAEAELMQLLGSLQGMVLRLARAAITKGLFETDGDSHDRRPPQFNRTAVTHRAQTSKRAASIQRATLRQQVTQRPSQRAIRAYTGQLLYVPSGMGSHQSVIERLRIMMWAQWVSLVPMIVAIAAALAKSATGNPGPALFGNIVTEIMIRRGVIQPSERSVWAGFLGGLWSSPMPRLMVLGITAGLIALRHGHAATNMIAAPGRGGRNPEAEALAAFEMAAS